MSTTQPTPSPGPSTSTSGYLDPEQLAPDEIFDHLIWENPEVCNGCFARIRDYEAHGDAATAANRLGTGNRPTETCVRTRDGVMGQDTHDHDRYGAIRSHYGRTYCGECGSPSGREPSETLSKREALARVDQLVTRFRERWLAIDPDTVRQVIHRGKSVPKWKDDDRGIVAAAVKLAVRRARDDSYPTDSDKPSPVG